MLFKVTKNLSGFLNDHIIINTVHLRKIKKISLLNYNSIDFFVGLSNFEVLYHCMHTVYITLCYI